MSKASQTVPFSLDSLPEYERKLLMALAFFLGRELPAQAVACLSMYLRQSEPRVIGQLNYYAHKASRHTGQSLSAYDLLDLIAESPENVAEMLQLGVVHQPGVRDVFDREDE